MMLFIAGLSTDFDDVDLKEMFELYGEVASARIITDRNTGKSKGFGFVDMTNTEEAKETIAILDNVVLGKKRISVKEAEPQQSRPAPGGYNSAPRSGGFNNAPRSGGYTPRSNNDRGGYNNDRGGYNNPRGNDRGSNDRGGFNRRDNNDDRFNKRY